MENLIFKSVEKLVSGLKSKQFSAIELVKAYIEQTKSVDTKIKAFLSLDEEKILQDAKKSDERRTNGKCLSDLDGIPIGIKDIFSEKGQPLTCASRILEHYISPYDSTVIKKIKNAGMIPFGRLNMDEFAMGSSSENSAFQITSNPWNLDCIPGGSSSGSAAAVCSYEVPLSIGTDTGGSVRQPAALCGIVGIKPTYGRISRYGIAAFASSLDQTGIFGRTVLSTANILNILCGFDSKDATSAKKQILNFREKISSKSKYTIGIPSAIFQDGLNDEVRKSINNAIEFYKQSGYTIKQIELKTLNYGIPAYYVIASAEASSNLARYDGIRYTHRNIDASTINEVFCMSRSDGFGKEVKRRILYGLYVLSVGKYDAYFYDKAQKVRRLIYNDFMKAFENVDAILTPTSPTVACKRGAKVDAKSMYLSDIYTVPASLAGLPGISIPCGFNSNNLPIGMQLIGKPFDESTILSIANDFEIQHKLYNKIPTTL